jgi:hypothetical protein
MMTARPRIRTMATVRRAPLHREVAMSSSPAAQATIRTSVPARLDRLKWSLFHTRMVVGLGAILGAVLGATLGNLIAGPTVTRPLTSVGAEAG